MADILCVLIADGDAVEAREIASALHSRYEEVEVVLARDGPEAYVQARRFRPDLAIVNADLDRIDGITLARTLRGSLLFRALPIVLILEGSATEKLRDALEARPSAILVRPFGREKLEQRVAEALRQPVPPRSATAPPGPGAPARQATVERDA